MHISAKESQQLRTSTVILEIVRVDVLHSATTCDLRTPAPLCACRCTRSRSHRTQSCKHARTHTETRVRGFVSTTKPRNVRCSETIVAMVKGTGNTHPRDTWFQRGPSGHRHEKGNKGSARDLLTSPARKGSCCSTFQNVSWRLFVELRSWGNHFASPLGNLRWKRRHGASISPRRRIVLDSLAFWCHAISLLLCDATVLCFHSLWKRIKN